MHPKLDLPLLGIVSSHDFFVVAAVLAAGTFGFLNTVWREELPAGRVFAALLCLCVIVFAGGRLHFALTKWQMFEHDPWRVLRISSGGLHAPGAILALVLGGLPALRWLRLPIGRFVDGLAPAVPIGIVFARVGCLLNGCCYGAVCDLPWGVTLPRESYTWYAQIEYGKIGHDAATTLPIHPLPAYFVLAALSITAFLLWLRPRRRYEGQLGLWLLFLFSLSSTLLEPLRAHHETRVYWAGQPQLFWISLGMTLLGIALLVVAHRRTQVAQPRTD